MATGAKKPEGLFLIPSCGSRLKLALLFLHGDLALCPPEVLEPLTECGDESLLFPVALGMRHQHADAPHLVGLLPVNRERPCRRRTAESAALPRTAKKSDELAPLHVPPLRTRLAKHEAYHFAIGRRGRNGAQLASEADQARRCRWVIRVV